MSFYQGPSLTVLRLSYSLRLDGAYKRFLRELKAVLEHPNGSTTHISRSAAINAALEVLRTKRGEVAGGAGATTADQDKDVVGQPPALEDKAENALKLLVLNSTGEFGFAPRDVYEGIFSPMDIKNQHANAIWKISRPGNLVALVGEFSVDCSLSDIDSCVAAMHPSENRDGDDDWEIDFKSTRIAERAPLWQGGSSRQLIIHRRSPARNQDIRWTIPVPLTAYSVLKVRNGPVFEKSRIGFLFVCTTCNGFSSLGRGSPACLISASRHN